MNDIEFQLFILGESPSFSAISNFNDYFSFFKKAFIVICYVF